MKLLLWNTKGRGSKVKSPINKKEITFTCCQGPVLLKDWCSHIKSAPWKVLPKLYECQLYRFCFFSLLCITFRTCSVALSEIWYWDLCLFVGLVILKILKFVFGIDVCMLLYFFGILSVVHMHNSCPRLLCGHPDWLPPLHSLYLNHSCN